MSDHPSDRVELGSTELPDVLRTLAGVLPQFAGDDLESQLQTYDTFLGFLDPSVRPQVAALLSEAASRATSEPVRARIAAAAESVAQGGRATEPYDHAKAMEAYRQSFREANPAPSPEAVVESDPAPKADAGQTEDDEDEADDESEEDDDDAGEEDEAAPAATTPRQGRTHPQLLAQLDLIEAEMKRIGYWSDNPPDLQAAVDRGEIKSFLDAPTFELWLQVLFLPRARKAAQDDALPAGSQVGEMARRQYDYMSVDVKAEQLLHLLQHFDELVDEANRGRPSGWDER